MLGLGESEEEIQLSLDLSIGGSYGGRCEKPKQLVEESLCKDEESSVEKAVPRSSSFSEAFVVVGKGDQIQVEARESIGSGGSSEAVDQNRKIREIQALRRREARRKREEKLRKSAANFKGIDVVNDKVRLEAQQLQARAQDREMKEEESASDYQNHELDGSKEEKNVAACVINNDQAIKDSNFNKKQGSGPREASDSCQQKNHIGGVKIPEALFHQQSQCGPLNKNGSVYRYGMACLGPRGVVGKEENEMMRKKCMFQTALACGSFRPYLNGNVVMNMRHNSGVGCDSGHNSGDISRIVNPNALSSSSLDRSSSAVSDYRSTSVKGGSISDTGSHSSCLQANDRQSSLSVTSGVLNQQPELNCPLNKREVGKEMVRAANFPKQIFLSKEEQNCTVGASRNSKPETKSIAVTPELYNTTSNPPKQSSVVANNPSKVESQNFTMPSPPQMPCVSTTGNGPNGKTITGFLYRYTKAEIRIVCVCHGSSFSPAEFVEHSGGIDITHPLRHITMIPSSFG